MSGSGEGVSGMVRISQNEGGAGTFPDRYGQSPMSDDSQLTLLFPETSMEHANYGIFFSIGQCTGVRGSPRPGAVRVEHWD